MLTNFDAKDREYLRRFSVRKNSRDTEGSNLPRSGSQSSIFGDSPDAAMIASAGDEIATKRSVVAI
jgi:hypothetical protein